MVRWRTFLVGSATLLVLAGGVTLAWKTRTEAMGLVTNPIETRRLPTRRPIDFGMVYDDVAVTTQDGLRLVGWWIPPTNGGVVLAQHGYKSQRGEMLNEAAMLHAHGYGVLITSIRAHDMSDGRLMTFGRNELGDLEAWVRFATAQPGVDVRRIGMIGNSLGGTLAIQLAARMPEIKGVVANSPFSSLRDTVATSVRFFTGLPPFPFVPLITFWAEREAGIDIDDVDATSSIGRLAPRPVLLMQGGADVVISTSSGQHLYDAAREPKELWFDSKVGHAGFDTARPEEYERRVVTFFDRAMPGS